jgi:hypothetical protein
MGYRTERFPGQINSTSEALITIWPKAVLNFWLVLCATRGRRSKFLH